MSRPLRILFTNITLASRTGTEVYIKEAALGLLRRGHTPLVYSPDLGEIAEEIRAATVPVVDDLSQLGAPPDVIHGHHHQQAMTAFLHFPGVPAIFATHDWTVWHDAPPLFPRIRRYLAVDRTNRDRIVFEHGIPDERVRVVLNWANLDRFPPRRPLPDRPRRALVFSNYAREDTHLPPIREACRRAGLLLDVVGSGVGRTVADPGAVIADHDLVFAKAKSALEALAVGAAVVLCDSLGLGQLVTSADFDALRELNFGLRTLYRPLFSDLILREIERYDAQDAADVTRRVREEAGLEPALDRLIALYEEVIAEHKRAGPTDPAEELRAAAVYLREWAGWTPHLRNVAADIDKQKQWLDHRVMALEEELEQTRNVHEDALEQSRRAQEHEREETRSALEEELEQTRSAHKEVLEETRRSHEEALEETQRSHEEELRAVRRERDGLDETLRAITGTITWRLRAKLVRFPRLREAFQKIGKLARGTRGNGS